MVNEYYVPNFRIIESIDQCVWFECSTNNQKSEYCDSECKGYNTTCKTYLTHNKLKEIIYNNRQAKGIK